MDAEDTGQAQPASSHRIMPTDKLSRLRQQNREAQARYRQRLKEEVLELEARCEAVRTRVNSAIVERDRKKLLNGDVRARITAASEALLSSGCQPGNPSKPGEEVEQHPDSHTADTHESDVSANVAAYQQKPAAQATPASSTDTQQTQQSSKRALTTTQSTAQNGVLMPMMQSFSCRGLVCPREALTGQIGHPFDSKPGSAEAVNAPGMVNVPVQLFDPPRPTSPVSDSGIHDAQREQQQREDAVADACLMRVQTCSYGAKAYRTEAARRLGRCPEDVCWFLRTPFDVAAEVPLTFSTSMASLRCFYSEVATTLTLPLECCFLAAVMSRGVHGLRTLAAAAAHRAVSFDSSLEGGMISKQWKAADTMEQLDRAVETPPPVREGCHGTCGLADTFPLHSGVSCVVGAVCKQFRELLPPHEWLQAVAPVVSTLYRKRIEVPGDCVNGCVMTGPRGMRWAGPDGRYPDDSAPSPPCIKCTVYTSVAATIRSFARLCYDEITNMSTSARLAMHPQAGTSALPQFSQGAGAKATQAGPTAGAMAPSQPPRRNRPGRPRKGTTRPSASTRPAMEHHASDGGITMQFTAGGAGEAALGGGSAELRVHPRAMHARADEIMCFSAAQFLYGLHDAPHFWRRRLVASPLLEVPHSVIEKPYIALYKSLNLPAQQARLAAAMWRSWQHQRRALDTPWNRAIISLSSISPSPFPPAEISTLLDVALGLRKPPTAGFPPSFSSPRATNASWGVTGGSAAMGVSDGGASSHSSHGVGSNMAQHGGDMHVYRMRGSHRSQQHQQSQQPQQLSSGSASFTHTPRGPMLHRSASDGASLPALTHAGSSLTSHDSHAQYAQHAHTHGMLHAGQMPQMAQQLREQDPFDLYPALAEPMEPDLTEITARFQVQAGAWTGGAAAGPSPSRVRLPPSAWGRPGVGVSPAQDTAPGFSGPMHHAVLRAHAPSPRMHTQQQFVHLPPNMHVGSAQLHMHPAQPQQFPQAPLQPQHAGMPVSAGAAGTQARGPAPVAFDGSIHSALLRVHPEEPPPQPSRESLCPVHGPLHREMAGRALLPVVDRVVQGADTYNRPQLGLERCTCPLGEEERMAERCRSGVGSEVYACAHKALKALRRVHDADADLQTDYLGVLATPGQVFSAEQLVQCMPTCISLGLLSVDVLRLCQAASGDVRRQELLSPFEGPFGSSVGAMQLLLDAESGGVAALHG